MSREAIVLMMIFAFTLFACESPKVADDSADDGTNKEDAAAMTDDGYYCSHRQMTTVTKDAALAITESTAGATVDVEQLALHTSKVVVTKEATNGFTELAFVIKETAADTFAVCNAYYRGYLTEADGTEKLAFDAKLTGGTVTVDEFNLFQSPLLYNSGKYSLTFEDPNKDGASLTFAGDYYKASGTNRSE